MISGAMMLSLFVNLVIMGLIFWLIWWFIDYVGVPEPFHRVLKVVVGLVALIFLINILLSLGGTPLFRWGPVR
jgi:hypothetical protein